MSGGKRVVIVGFANSKEHVQWHEKPDEVWGINELHLWFEASPERYWTRWFELHPDDKIGPKKPSEADRGTAAAHWEWMARQTTDRPLYMQRMREDVPAAVEFPLWPLNEKFEKYLPGIFRQYFTSSIGLMLALAIAEGRDEHFQPLGDGTHFDRIDLYGIDLAGDSEYQYQRPNAEFFCGFAAGLGIQVYCDPDSAMFKGECIYGYEEPPAESGPVTQDYLEKHERDLQGQLSQAQEQITKQQAIYNTIHGAIQEIQVTRKLLLAAKRGVRAQNLVRVQVV